MRLWTLHPRHLDVRGLVAVWREGLLAQKVLHGETRGYHHHPQLTRFRATLDPLAAIAGYLSIILQESKARGYTFDAGKIGKGRSVDTIEETEGQLLYEWRHLRRKLQARDPERYDQCRHLTAPEPHPMFRIVPGDIQEWERQRQEGSRK